MAHQSTPPILDPPSAVYGGGIFSIDLATVERPPDYYSVTADLVPNAVQLSEEGLPTYGEAISNGTTQHNK